LYEERKSYLETSVKFLRNPKSSCTSDTATLETYYSNFIARQLYAQKYLKYTKIKYWQPVWV